MPGNRGAVAFHLRTGFRPAEKCTFEIEGTKVARNYGGTGQHRAVFVNELRRAETRQRA